MSTQAELQVSGHIARLTLRNPDQHNALTREGIAQILDHLDTVEHTTGLRVLVLTGSGHKTFCSGLSLDELRAGHISTALFTTLTDRLASLSLPKIAALNGSAYGGGVELGLCCDFRLGVTGMKIRVPAARFGLDYPENGIRRYVRELGAGTARRLLAGAETIEAPALIQLGYLHELTPPESLPTRVTEWTERLCSLVPETVRHMLERCNFSR